MSRSSRSFPWSGSALVFGGGSLVLFMLLHPPGGLESPETMSGTRWVLAHSFHFLGALLILFGLPALGRRLDAAGGIGRAALTVAFAGTAMFVGTGMISAFVWPILAAHDPALLSPAGPLLSGAGRALLVATYAALILGYVALGTLGFGHRVSPRPGWAALVVGSLLFALPVAPLGPAPWGVRIAGGSLVGIAFILVGLSAERGGSPRPAGTDEPSARPAAGGGGERHPA